MHVARKIAGWHRRNTVLAAALAVSLAASCCGIVLAVRAAGLATASGASLGAGQPGSVRRYRGGG